MFFTHKIPLNTSYGLRKSLKRMPSLAKVRVVSVKVKYLSKSASMHVGHVLEATYTHQLCL